MESYTWNELPEEARLELKQNYYISRHEHVSSSELNEIDSLVSDEELENEYGTTLFTRDDFFSLVDSE